MKEGVIRVKQIGRFKEWVNPTTVGQMSTSSLAVDKKGGISKSMDTTGCALVVIPSVRRSYPRIARLPP